MRKKKGSIMGKIITGLITIAVALSLIWLIKIIIQGIL